MSLLGFRLQQNRSAGSNETAARFVEALVAHDFRSAARLLDTSLSWFGEALAPAAWLQRACAALSQARLTGDRVTALEHHVLDAIDNTLASQILDGSVSPGHTLQIFDLQRDGTRVSLGILTRTAPSGETVVERVIDLLRFKACFG